MNQQPGRYTRPLGEYGDTFTSTSSHNNTSRYTQPLNQSPEAIKMAVSKRLSEINQELSGIRALVSLFTPYVRVLELAEELQAFPPEEIKEALIEPDPPIEDWIEADPSASEDNTESPSESLEIAEPVIEGPRKLFWDYNLPPEKQDLAIKVCERIRNNLSLRQRVQITIHQFKDTTTSYYQACQIVNKVFGSPPHEGWVLLDQVGIERLKGKAYSINGFYDHFKMDPVLGKLFPPPHFSPVQYTPSFTGERAPATAPLEPPPPPPKKGLMGNLKDLFGKKS